MTMRRWLLVAIFLTLAITPARSETLDEPYGHCDQQTLDGAVALGRLGYREALRDHVRSYGCRGQSANNRGGNDDEKGSCHSRTRHGTCNTGERR
jgi:hypothetical protein